MRPPFLRFFFVVQTFTSSHFDRLRGIQQRSFNMAAIKEGSLKGDSQNIEPCRKLLFSQGFLARHLNCLVTCHFSCLQLEASRQTPRSMMRIPMDSLLLLGITVKHQHKDSDGKVWDTGKLSQSILPDIKQVDAAIYTTLLGLLILLVYRMVNSFYRYVTVYIHYQTQHGIQMSLGT